jgi:predicted transcriptional regulator
MPESFLFINLMNQRGRLGLSKKELAKDSGVAPMQVTKAELGLPISPQVSEKILRCIQNGYRNKFGEHLDEQEVVKKSRGAH